MFDRTSFAKSPIARISNSPNALEAENWPAAQGFMRWSICLLLALSFMATAVNFALASKRVALVIGNSKYQNAGELANPSNDAADISAALNELGFKVTTGLDLDSRGMREKIREFSRDLRGADTAMLYYAGHAMQVGGKNYLAPVDTRLEFESDLDFETIPLQFIQDQMQREAKTILLFLDACRDNPLTRSLKLSSRSQGAGRGLAEEKLASSGILIAFATNPENVALDGTGRNSPFTRAMLDNIKRPGVEISSLMTDVRVQVVKETSGAQTPWINSALLGRFYFNPEEKAVAEAAKNKIAKKSAEDFSGVSVPSGSHGTAQVNSAQIAALAYDAVKDTNNIAVLEVFISNYGDTFFGQLAELRLERLKLEAAKNSAKETPVETATKEGDKPAEETKLASLDTKSDNEPVKRTLPIEPVKPVDLKQVKYDIQARLTDLGCKLGKVDGLWGKRSQRALDTLVRVGKFKPVSSVPSEALRDQLKDYNGKGCPAVVRSASKPKTCAAGQKLSSKGNCYTPKSKVAKTCKSGQRLSSKGNCYTPKAKKVVKTCPQGQRLSSKGNCYIPRQNVQPQQPVVVKRCPAGTVMASNGACFVPQQNRQPVIVQQNKPSLGKRIIGGVVCALGRIC